jgi:hypothetical protein
MDAEIKSEQMFNINMSYGVVVALKKIQEKIGLNVDDWEAEDKLEEK